jgi:lipopolysaccharide transport system ATP-binding protein
MVVRLGFAVSSLMDPDVLIIDEVLAVGDMGFVIKCLNRMSDILHRSAVIFVSHSMPMVSRICTSSILMDHGAELYHGNDVPFAIEQYVHRFETGLPEQQGTGDVVLESIALRSKEAPIWVADGSYVHQNGDDLSIKLYFRTGSVDLSHVFVIILDQQLREAVSCSSDENYAPLMSRRDGYLRLEVRLDRLYLNRGKHTITVGVSDPDSKKLYCRTTNTISFMVRSKTQSWATSVMPGEWSHLDGATLESPASMI